MPEDIDEQNGKDALPAAFRENGKPSRRHASPGGLARPKPRSSVTRKDRPQDRLVIACEVEPCRCPLVPRAGSLHDLLRRINGEDWPDESKAGDEGKRAEPRERRSHPLEPLDRLAAWVLGMRKCWHSERPGLMKRPKDVLDWDWFVANWSDQLARSDRMGHKDRPTPPPVDLPASPATRVAIYAARVARGQSCFSPHDTVEIPAREAVVPLSPVDAGLKARRAVLDEARAMGRARGVTFFMGEVTGG